MKHYFTLSHVEPGFCVVEADSPWEARQEMLRKMGRKYIEVQYSEKEWYRNGKSVAEIYNLHEMK